MRLAANKGDVFTVPLDIERVGIGQVVGVYGRSNLYLAIYKQPVSSVVASTDVDIALESGVALAGLSMDAKIHCGDWKVVARRAIPPSVVLSAYKESVGPGSYQVVDSSGSRRRPATREEALFLPNRKVVAPVRFEKAFQAMNGVGSWADSYGTLVPLSAQSEEHFFRT